MVKGRNEDYNLENKNYAILTAEFHLRLLKYLALILFIYSTKMFAWLGPLISD
jgi:hypothetical protein